MKSRTRKAMRVATIFTGTAVYAITQGNVANAQPIRPVAPASSRFGKIQERSDFNCPGSWVHMYEKQFIGSTTHCFGFHGSAGNIGKFSQVCGGNNIGYFWGSLAGQSFHYGHGDYFHKFGNYWVVNLYLSKWSGPSKCQVTPNIPPVQNS